MTNITPGKWELGYNQNGFSENYGQRCVGIRSTSQSIAVLPVKDEHTEANALMICAAPQMFEMLEKILALHTTDGQDDDWVLAKEARDLLDKVKGEA